MVNKKVVIDMDNKASFVLDKNNMPEKLILKKFTSKQKRIIAQSSLSPEEMSSHHKKTDVCVAAVSLKNNNEVYDVLVYEPDFSKEIENVLEELVKVNDLNVLDVANFRTSTKDSPKFYLGNGSYQSYFQKVRD